MQFPRLIESDLERLLNKNRSILLFGPRQTGKSTLIENFLAKVKQKKIVYRLQDINNYQELIKNPELVQQRVELELKSGPVLLFIDEVQKIPILMDSCQYLIDTYKEKIRVILSGSSARKLRVIGTNLLPGRVIIRNLHSLILPEIQEKKEQRIVPIKFQPDNYPNTNISLEDLLLYGSLPGILKEKENEIREDLLKSYVLSYLEEEIRAEALSRNLGLFSRFLELSAFESNSSPNMSKLSQETGIPISTIKNYFQLLEDTLITYSIPAFRKKSRKQILTTPKYIYYDTGIRNAASGMPLNKQILKTELSGKLFEHFISLELIKRIKYQHSSWKYFHFRTNHGIEVDFVIQTDDELIPIEIKYTNTPDSKHIRHLKVFMEEFNCKQGYLIGLFKNALKLEKGIYAIPWNEI